MIPLGILASSYRTPDTGPPGPGGFATVQEWDVAVQTSLAVGPQTTVGNLVLARAVHRAGTSGLPAAIADSGSNTWHPVGQAVAGGSGDVYFWYTIVETPFGQVNVGVDGGTSIGRVLFVAEWSGNATADVLLDSAAQHNDATTGPLPVAEVATTVPGALVAGVLGATVSNRTFDLLTPGYVAGREHRSQQTTLISAARADAPAGTHGPQWSLGGSSSTTGAITAAFRPAEVH